MNQEGVIISDLGESPPFFMLFPYFVYSAHLAQFTHGSSLLMEKSLLMGESKAEKSPW